MRWGLSALSCSVRTNRSISNTNAHVNMYHSGYLAPPTPNRFAKFSLSCNQSANQRSDMAQRAAYFCSQAVMEPVDTVIMHKKPLHHRHSTDKAN